MRTPSEVGARLRLASSRPPNVAGLWADPASRARGFVVLLTLLVNASSAAALNATLVDFDGKSTELCNLRAIYRLPYNVVVKGKSYRWSGRDVVVGADGKWQEVSSPCGHESALTLRLFDHQEQITSIDIDLRELKQLQVTYHEDRNSSVQVPPHFGCGEKGATRLTADGWRTGWGCVVEYRFVTTADKMMSLRPWVFEERDAAGAVTGSIKFKSFAFEVYFTAIEQEPIYCTLEALEGDLCRFAHGWAFDTPGTQALGPLPAPINSLPVTTVPRGSAPFRTSFQNIRSIRAEGYSMDDDTSSHGGVGRGALGPRDK